MSDSCMHCGARLNMGDNQWISVEDRLPKIIEGAFRSEDVIAFCISHGQPNEWGFPNTFPEGESYCAIDSFMIWPDTRASFRNDRIYGKVTHWMPLPKPPKE